MKNKLKGSFYPYCNSQKTFYTRRESYNGQIYIKDGCLVFQKINFFLFRSKICVAIRLKDIDHVDVINLNGFLPYGVLVVTKDGKEYMFGHNHNSALQKFIQDAKSGLIMEITDSDLRKEKVKKIILGTILMILMSFIILITTMVIHDFKQEDIILEELNIINNLDITSSEIDMTIKTSDEYGKVELAIKEYYRDFFQNSSLYYTNSAVSLFNMLTIDYLKENKGKLKEMDLFNMVITKTKELDIAINNIIMMLNEDTIMGYVEKYDLDEYYVNFYRENMVSSYDNEYQKNWEKFKSSNALKVEYLNKILEILIDHDDVWYIEDNTLYISDDDILNEYNSLHDKIYDEEENEEFENTI